MHGNRERGRHRQGESGEEKQCRSWAAPEGNHHRAELTEHFSYKTWLGYTHQNNVSFRFLSYKVVVNSDPVKPWVKLFQWFCLMNLDKWLQDHSVTTDLWKFNFLCQPCFGVTESLVPVSSGDEPSPQVGSRQLQYRSKQRKLRGHRWKRGILEVSVIQSSSSLGGELMVLLSWAQL